MSPSALRSSLSHGLVLGAFGLCCIGGLALLHQLLAEPIRVTEQQRQARLLRELLPVDTPREVRFIATPALEHPLLANTPAQPAYQVQYQGRLLGVILPLTTHAGYSGAIRLLMAVQADGRISGVRVQHHRETPGLGDKIERPKSPWIDRFTGHHLHSLPSEAWTVKKEGGAFDQFAGATITPKAVVKAVYQGLLYLEQNPELLQQPLPDPQTP